MEEESDLEEIEALIGGQLFLLHKYKKKVLLLQGEEEEGRDGNKEEDREETATEETEAEEIETEEIIKEWNLWSRMKGKVVSGRHY